jgi:hypothetical protein
MGNKLTTEQTEYLDPYIDDIDVSHQITHLCVPELSSKCISEEFVTNIKDTFGIHITIVPFDKILFQSGIYDGIYLLIDCIDDFQIIKGIETIQRHIKENKKRNLIERGPLDDFSWTATYLSYRRHKWDGKWIVV